MTTVQSKATMRRDTLDHIKRIVGLDNDDIHLLLANHFLHEDLTLGLSDDKCKKLEQVTKFLKLENSTLTESTTIEEVERKVQEGKKKKEKPQGLTKEVKNEYLAACKGKYFLASKAVDKYDGYGSLEYISNMKIKLEAVYGAKIGAGDTRRLLKENGGFEEGNKFGAFNIVLNDDLGLHHKDLGERVWQEHYRDYAAATKYGVLIMAGKPEYFQIWAKSNACLEEVSKIPDGRLFAYIEHRVDDGFDKDEGFIVSIDAKDKLGSATVRDGKGYFIFASGNYYHGELKGGYRNGFGTLMYASGEKYEGQYKDGKRHGSGIFKYASGAVYDGEWEDDKRHGKGVYKYAVGNVYDGEWKDNKMHGSGIFKYASGAVYDGEWKDDNKHGRGEFKYASGNVYDGEWEDGKKHGKGVFKYGPGKWEGDVYDGEWENDKKHDRNAIYTFANGNKYNMVWENDKQISKTKIN